MRRYIKKLTATAAVLSIVGVLGLGQPALAVSQSGYMLTPDDPNPGGSGIKSGSFGTFTLPGKGQVTIDYEDVNAESHLLHFNDALTPEYLALGHNTSSQIIPVLYQMDAAAADGTVTYKFERAWRDINISLLDIDTSDVVTIRAVDEQGNVITDFSSWTVVGSGDVMTSNPSGGPKPAPAPLWNASIGELTSATPGINASRGFITLQPNVAISELSLHLAAPGSGEHLYSTIWSNATPELSLGNLVWWDTNNNGLVDPDETGIPGVAVELLDENGGVLDSATTNSQGQYRFDDLAEGRYRVRIAGSNFAEGGALASARSSLYGAEPAVANNPRLNNIDTGTEGANLVANGVTSGLMDLWYDNGPVTDGDTLRWTYYSADFGFITTNTATPVNDPDDRLADTGSPVQLFTLSGSGVLVAGMLLLVFRQRLYSR